MKYINQIILVVFLSLITAVGAHAAINPKPFVIPELREWKGSEGLFTPSSRTRIVYLLQNHDLKHIAYAFAEDYYIMFGVKLEVVAGEGKAGDFIFGLRADKELGKEGYSIIISDRVSISAPEEVGVYWATRTLLQISEQSNVRSLSRGIIRDFPDYEIRGFMLDCGRKFIPMSFLHDYVKMMAYYKMNTFQIHLNDNGFKQYFEHDWSKTYAAFRLELDTYPGLTARDGYYTKREFIDLQILAEDNFVEIIPEIDIPAHTLAFAHYRPELGSKEYGMDHLDLFNPATYTFIDSLFREYLEGDSPVFRGKRVHIGTDEYSNAKQDVVEKFRFFTDHYIRYIESIGKQACVWGALTHAQGSTPVKSENVVMSAWHNSFAQPKDMIKRGYQLISIPDELLYIVPAVGYYQDYLNIGKLYNEWTPAHIGEVVFEEKHPSILGGMFALWNDHVGNGISTKDIHHRIFPALQTLAVKMWSGKNAELPFTEFNKERNKLSEAPGVNQRGRIKQAYSQTVVLPESKLPLREIGYNYQVTFDVEGGVEDKGTELFRSPDAVFYLSDPIKGMLGFARDGYLNTFNYRILPGEKVSIGINGDNRATRLLVNGKMMEELNIQKYYYDGGKDSMSYVRTLVFPLEETGKFKSRITNLEVTPLSSE